MLAQIVRYALRNPPDMPRICSDMLSIFGRGALGVAASAARDAAVGVTTAVAVGVGDNATGLTEWRLGLPLALLCREDT